MKKSWKLTLASVLTALILFIGFNSFSTKEQKPQTETPYYWYEFDPGTSTVGALLTTGTKITKTAAMSTLTACPDGSGTICIRGYDNEDEEDNVDTNPPGIDDAVQRQ